MEGIVDVCAHPKICGLEPFHLFIFRRACCVACIARALCFFFVFVFWIPLSQPLHSGRGFGFIVQIAASLFSSNFGRWGPGAWARRFGTSVEERSLAWKWHVVFVSRSLLYIFFLERSDVWDYSEAFTKRYILLIVFGCRLLLSCFFPIRVAFLLLHATSLVGDSFSFL